MSHPNLANFYKSISKNKFLLFAILAGLVLRGLNPTFGSPSLFVSNDEAIAHLSAFNMIANKTPISIANYTPLGAYLQIPFLLASFLVMKISGLVSNAGDFELFVLTHEGYFLFVPRLISAFFGTLTILVIYKITLLLFKNSQTAIISAFLTAVSFNLVHISHFGRPWAAALFLFTLAVYFLIKNKAFYSYLAVSLSYGFHQVGILAIPLVVWLTKKRFTFKNLLGVFVSALILFTFSSLTIRNGLIESIRRDQSFLKVGKLAADILTGNPDLLGSAVRSVKENLFLFFSVNLLLTDGIIFLLAIWGMAKLSKLVLQKKLSFYILGYFLLAVLFFHPLPRYLLPIFLLSIPFAADSLTNIFKRSKFLFITLLVVSSFNSLWWNYLYLKTPTFIQVNNWLNQNVSKDIPVAYIGGRYQTFLPNKQAINLMQSSNLQTYSRLSSILPKTGYSNVRNIVYVSNFVGNTKIEQLHSATDNYPVLYVIDYYIEPSEKLINQAPGSFKIVAQFNPTRSSIIAGIPEPLFDASWNFPFNDQRPKVSMYSLDRIGPYFDILEVKN